MNIDSDKLLEFIDELMGAALSEEKHAEHDGDNDYSHFHNGGRNYLGRLHAKIKSGELTPKRVYARAPDGDYGAFGYLTPGREYEVIDDDGEFFDVVEDNGVKIICKWRADDHIYGANWERVEK